jgi:hypothetical protein
MKKILIIILILLSGCSVTNRGVYKEVKECDDMGYGHYEGLSVLFTFGLVRNIHCDFDNPKTDD